eukprot:CAMPEP_0115693434 /NCGR_PEP_ID=MMETSP0272-20121206/63720_1 /TAXON_ID=71861 /ORGANISM="Scrippsiella trochoidea, Strain CCMP3099" /LENGTH=352 /DNA_ID=CAMNT_0003133545 /DNA_START=293 /DNA_END=1354 /DNA_ORIENTATION=+
MVRHPRQSPVRLATSTLGLLRDEPIDDRSEPIGDPIPLAAHGIPTTMRRHVRVGPAASLGHRDVKVHGLASIDLVVHCHQAHGVVVGDDLDLELRALACLDQRQRVQELAVGDKIPTTTAEHGGELAPHLDSRGGARETLVLHQPLARSSAEMPSQSAAGRHQLNPGWKARGNSCKPVPLHPSGTCRDCQPTTAPAPPRECRHTPPPDSMKPEGQARARAAVALPASLVVDLKHVALPPGEEVPVVPKVVDRVAGIDVHLARIAAAAPADVVVAVCRRAASEHSAVGQVVTTADVGPREPGAVQHDEDVARVAAAAIVAPNVVHAALVHVELAALSVHTGDIHIAVRGGIAS